MAAMMVMDRRDFRPLEISATGRDCENRPAGVYVEGGCGGWRRQKAEPVIVLGHGDDCGYLPAVLRPLKAVLRHRQAPNLSRGWLVDMMSLDIGRNRNRLGVWDACGVLHLAEQQNGRLRERAWA